VAHFRGNRGQRVTSHRHSRYIDDISFMDRTKSTAW